MNKFYITTSLPYVNAAPHIGFALEAVQADVLARWHKQQGEEVFFLTGTDEHGAKIARAAEAAGKTPQELVDENSAQFYALKDALKLSWDNFIRTSDQKKHWPVAQELWQRLEKAGALYKKTYKGLYCVGHEAFVTQKDLVDGKCRDHKKEPEELSEENWFFKLSDYTKDVESRIKNQELKIVPETRKNEVLGLLKENPEDISFSRPSKDLTWGITVPGDNTQTMYVWADALTNYISGYGGIEAWEKHPADIHVVGKDILRFHAVIWTAMLLAAKLPLPKTIFVHGHILSDGQKMSKSLGNVVDPFELVKKYGADAVRYFLLREIPSSEDGDFSYEKFEQRYNADLANGLGNLIARVTTLGSKLGDIEIVNRKEFDFLKNQYRTDHGEWFDRFELDKLLIGIWDAIHRLDAQISLEEPWKDKDETILKNKILNYSPSIILIADFLTPFLPDAAKSVKNCFIEEGNILKIKRVGNLFPRI